MKKALRRLIRDSSGKMRVVYIDVVTLQVVHDLTGYSVINAANTTQHPEIVSNVNDPKEIVDNTDGSSDGDTADKLISQAIQGGETPTGNNNAVVGASSVPMTAAPPSSPTSPQGFGVANPSSIGPSKSQASPNNGSFSSPTSTSSSPLGPVDTPQSFAPVEAPQMSPVESPTLSPVTTTETMSPVNTTTSTVSSPTSTTADAVTDQATTLSPPSTISAPLGITSPNTLSPVASESLASPATTNVSPASTTDSVEAFSDPNTTEAFSPASFSMSPPSEVSTSTVSGMDTGLDASSLDDAPGFGMGLPGSVLGPAPVSVATSTFSPENMTAPATPSPSPGHSSSSNSSNNNASAAQSAISNANSAALGLSSPNQNATVASNVAAVQSQGISPQSLSPAAFAMLGINTATPADKSAVGLAIAGEMNAKSLAGLTRGDPAALAEAASITSTAVNRSAATQKSIADTISNPTQYNAFMPAAMTTTTNNYAQFQPAIDSMVESYFSGKLGVIGDPNATHYANFAVASPAWGPALIGPQTIGPHTFGRLSNEYSPAPAVMSGLMNAFADVSISNSVAMGFAAPSYGFAAQGPNMSGIGTDNPGPGMGPTSNSSMGGPSPSSPAGGAQGASMGGMSGFGGGPTSNAPSGGPSPSSPAGGAQGASMGGMGLGGPAGTAASPGMGAVGPSSNSPAGGAMGARG